MTLILTALTPRHIVQVSDRRVVEDDDTPLDGHVKAIVTPSFSCAYSGAADLDAGTGHDDTAYWLAISLSDHVRDSDGGIRGLATAAEREMRKACHSGRTLRIVCAGWMERDGLLTPKAKVIAARGWDDVDHPVEIRSITVGRPPSAVYAAPAWLTDEEIDNVNLSVQELCNSGSDTARSLAQLLTECIRETSRSSADRRLSISEDVIVTSLPRPDLVGGNVVIGHLAEDYWSVTNIGPGPGWAERHGGPIIVGHQAVVRALSPEEGPPGLVGAELVRNGNASVHQLSTPYGVGWGWPGVHSAAD